ncbi:MAG: hypothetical protein KBS97_00300 [Firmicutes bacterium]|nr:hypothetical protein [Candidatus Fiminaster equi]
MEATKQTKKWTNKRIAKLVVDIVCWIFFVFALVFTVFAFTAQSSVAKFPTFGGKAMLTVESGSMEGDHGFKAGDLIIVKILPDGTSEDAKIKEERKAAISELKPTVYSSTDPTKIEEYGSVVTFWKDLNADGTLELNTHRIISIETRPDGHYEYITKGDHNNSVDPYKIIDNDIIGVWTGSRVAGMGSFISFLQPGEPIEKHLGFILFIILPLAGFLTYEVVYLVLVIKKAKNKDKRLISAAEEELIKQQAVEEFLKKQEAEKASDKSTDDK